MLLYQPPFLDVGNLTIFRDDTDAETFYYVTVQPNIVLTDSGPAISAYTVLPQSGEAGEASQVIDTSLSMEVSLKVSEESLEQARKQIKEQWGSRPKRLLPATISDGKVYLILAAAGEKPDPKDWYISSGVSPSIFGDNRAALVVKTEAEEAKRLVAALTHDLVAGHVYYNLNMLGIAPTFKARMQVQWNRIYKHFEDLQVENYIFSKEEISNTFDDLKENSFFQMEIEELDPEAGEAASKTLLNEIKAEAVKRLFNPAVPPLSASEKIENRIASGFSQLHASIIPGSHYILRNNHEAQTSSLLVDLRERKVKKYPFYPQAILSGMIQRAGGLQDHLKWIKLDDLPFRSKEVSLNLAADTFSISNIRSVKVDLQVQNESLGQKEREFTFVFDDVKKLKASFSFIQQKDQQYSYRYRASIYLNNEGTGLPPELSTAWQQQESAFIHINPAAFFENVKLRIAIDDPGVFEHTQLIEVNVQVKERETTRLLLTQSFTMQKAATEDQQYEKVLSMLFTKLLPVQLDLQLIYYVPGAEDYIINLPDHQDYNFFLPNPFENKWSVDLLARANWESTLKLIAELRVWDVARNTWLTDKFTMEPAKTEATFHAVTSLQTPKERLEYRITAVKQDGSIIRSSWKEHEGLILVIRDDVKAERLIKAMLKQAPDFEEKEIKKVTVSFMYHDPRNNLMIESENLRFRGIGDILKFMHPMPDQSTLEYKYRVMASSKRGDRYKTDWISSRDEDLEIIIPSNIW